MNLKIMLILLWFSKRFDLYSEEQHILYLTESTFYTAFALESLNLQIKWNFLCIISFSLQVKRREPFTRPKPEENS